MNKIFLLILSVVFLLSGSLLSAKVYKAAISELPVTPIYINLLKNIAQVTDNSFDIQVVPTARGIYLVESAQVDLFCPGTLIKDVKKLAEQKSDFMTSSVGTSVYVLYTNKSKPLDIESLRKGNTKKYKIETNTNVAEILNFTVLPTSNLEASLQKVSNGVIDGFILPQISGDQLLKKLDLKNIKRELYSKETIAFRIQKGQKGGELDKVLTDGINKLKASKKYDEIMANIIKQAEYIEWQP